MQNVVKSKDVLDLRKREMLHKKWNDRVYEPLRGKIIDVMDGEDWPELDRRKRELHKQYLEFVNQKVSCKDDQSLLLVTSAYYYLGCGYWKIIENSQYFQLNQQNCDTGIFCCCRIFVEFSE